MNKIFKVIWNHTAQRFVVTSELTKSNGKSSSNVDNRIEPSKALLALGVAGAAMLGAGNAMAEATANTPISISGNDIYIASDADGNTAFGKNAYATNPANTDATLSLAIGANAKASGNATTAIGRGSVATSDWSMAIGSGAAATGSNDVAIGEGAKSSAPYAVALGKASNASSETAVSIGYQSEAKKAGTVAVGRSAIADGNLAVAIGMQALATGANSTSIGQRAATNAADAIAIGTSAGILPGVGASSGDSSIAIGRSSLASGTRAVALGRSTWARGLRSTAMGQSANTEADYSIAIGNNANVTVATATNSIAMGNVSVVSGSNSIGIGPDSNVTGNSSIAVGVGNVVSGDGAGAFGDPSIIAGAGSYTQGNDNAVGSQSTNVGAFGNNNQIGATGTYSNGKLQTASGLANEVTVVNSRVIGNNNYINSSNTYVLGSGVGVKDDGSLFTSKTVENSVYLGNDSTIAKGAKVGTKNLTKEEVEGTTTTAGDTGTVKTANVSSIIYGGFAGDTAKGAVTVGSAGEERRIMNVAAGEISKTSTDAINGSQLYLVASHITDNAPFQYVDKDGKPVVKIGDKYYPAGTVTDANGNIVDKDGNPVQPVADQESVVIKAKSTNPENITNVKGNLDNTYSGKKDIDGNEIKPTTEASLPGKFDPTSSNFNKGVLNNAASVGDVLNAGWNLQENGSAVDFVKPYDTVNFINGVGTTVKVNADENGKVSTVQVNGLVAVTDKDGNVLIQIKEGDETKWYKAEDLVNGKPKDDAKPVDASDTQVNVINPSKTNNTKGDATQLGNVAAGANILDGSTDEKGNPLVKVTAEDGTTKYYALDQFTEGKLNQDATASEPKENKNLNDAYKGLADLASSNPTNVLTIADAKNLGWVVSASGNDYADDVRNANQVDFVGTGLAAVTGETKNGIRTITINVDAQQIVDGAQNPVVYTDTDGNKLTKGQDGNFYKTDDIQDLVYNATDKKYYPKDTTFDEQGNPNPNQDGTIPQPVDLANKVVNKDDVIASMNNGSNKTDPTTLTNVKGNLDNTYSGKKDIDGNEIKPTTEASLPGKFDPTSSNFNKGVLNNAATVGDVLNAGWNLQGNGSAVDFVKPYDTVNFINGVGTTVKVNADENGKVSTVQVNSLVAVTDKDGNVLIQIKEGDETKWYKAEDLVNGKPKDDAKPVNASDTQVNVINPSETKNTKGDATQLGNVAAGTETLSNPVDKDGNQLVKAKDGKYYPAGTELNEDGSVKSADAKPVATQPTENVSNAYNGLADLNGSNATNVLTVADAKKLGWVVSASGNDYADDVRNANRVDFVGKDGIKVTGETTAAGVREITISLEKGEVAKSNEKTITVDGEKKDVVEVTDDEGKKTYYEKDNIDPTTGKPTDTTKALTPDEGTKVENKGSGFVDGNQVADAIQKSGFYVSKETDASAVDFNNKEEKINPDDKLKFADGTGTTVNLGTVKQLDDKGEVSTTTVVKVDIDQGTMEVEDGKLVDKATETAKDALTQAEKALTDLKADPNTTAEDLVEAAQKVIDAQKLLDDLKTKGEDVVKAEADLKTAQEALKTLKADEQTTPEQLIKAANDALAAEKALEKAQNKVATVQNVVDTINKSGFNLKTSATAEGEKVSGSDELINPGDAVEMVAGKNLTVKQEADGKVTFATKDKVAFTEVKVGDTVLNDGGLTIKNGPSITASGIDAGDKKITNVADGEISPTSKDAVNGSQLYNVAQNINNRLGDVNKRIDDVDRAGRRGAAIAGAIGMIPQPHMSGRSMVGVATTSYRGEQALALGYSRISDNSKHIIKFSGSSNMSGKKDMMVGAAYGYQW